MQRPEIMSSQAFAGTSSPSDMPPGIIRELSQINTVRGVSAIFIQWGIILLTVVGCTCLDSLPVYLAGALVIAGRQHALAVLLHDAAHRRLLPHRQLNDWIASLILAMPLFVSLRLYRLYHLRHHRHLNSSLDPDLIKPEQIGGRGFWARYFLRSVVGLGLVSMFRNAASYSILSALRVPRGRVEVVTIFSFYGAVAAVLATMPTIAFKFLTFWIAPLVLLLPGILRFRAAAEHSVLALGKQTRTTYSPVWEAFLFSPLNVNFHYEHHLYPAIPWYSLRKAHYYIRQRNDYPAAAHVTSGGYLFCHDSVLAEFDACGRTSSK